MEGVLHVFRESLHSIPYWLCIEGCESWDELQILGGHHDIESKAQGEGPHNDKKGMDK
jgi:hypothetical protein